MAMHTRTAMQGVASAAAIKHTEENCESDDDEEEAVIVEGGTSLTGYAPEQVNSQHALLLLFCNLRICVIFRPLHHCLKYKETIHRLLLHCPMCMKTRIHLMKHMWKQKPYPSLGSCWERQMPPGHVSSRGQQPWEFANWNKMFWPSCVLGLESP